MPNKQIIDVQPQSVVVPWEDGPRVFFTCDVSPECANEPSFWATCGQRRRFPVPAHVVARSSDTPRRYRVAVDLPRDYCACTLHAQSRTNRWYSFKSCRVDEPLFRTLAARTTDAISDEGYHAWFEKHRTNRQELFYQQTHVGIDGFDSLISVIVPVFRTPERYLKRAIASILEQTYSNLELIVVNASGTCDEVDRAISTFDDPRLRIIAVQNRSIPENTNEGIRVARGDYLAFVDHDDFIEPDALYRYAKVIAQHPKCDLLFCDEDLWDGDRYFGARFKPGWNPDFLLTQNYACHMLMVSRWALDRVELSPARMNGAQDYDLTLKVSEVAREVRHVPGILYHWRVHPNSTATNSDSKPYADTAGMLAIEEHLSRMGIDARVLHGNNAFTYRLKYPAAHENTAVVIPFGADAMQPATDWEKRLPKDVEVIRCRWDDINTAIASSTRDYIAVFGSGAVPANNADLGDLIGPLNHPGVRCSTALVLDSSCNVLSSGLAVDDNGIWHHCFAGVKSSSDGYMRMLGFARDILAAPLYCLAFRKDAFVEAAGFDLSLRPDWASIDFCLKLHSKDARIRLTPDFAVIAPGILSDLADEPYRSTMAKRYPLANLAAPLQNPHLDSSSGHFTLPATDPRKGS